MKFIACLSVLIMCFSTLVNADVFELRELYLLHKKFGDGSRNPLIDDNGLENRELDREVSLIWNMDILEYGYFDNKILSYVDRFKDSGESDQFRLVGWNLQLGIRLTGWLWVEYDHFSKHQLDNEAPGKFPVEDAFGIRVYFYKKDYKDGIFGL